jgi:hypothetical protein
MDKNDVNEAQSSQRDDITSSTLSQTKRRGRKNMKHFYGAIKAELIQNINNIKFESQ